MQRYFVYLAYNGKNYCGWQIQPNGISIQACLEKAFGTLLRNPISVTGAGRTDSGVHAKLMVAHFDSVETDLDNDSFVDKLNRLLPEDIVIFNLKKVNPNAHARFDAVSRTYNYYISDKKNPFAKDYVWKIHNLPDIEKMNEACKILYEYTDFTSFSKLHTDVKTNNCKIIKAEWTNRNDILVFTIQADRFLRNMVRAIVGTMIDVGRGKITLEQFREIIEQKDRCKAGISVPAHGLFLMDISYEKNIFKTEKR